MVRVMYFLFDKGISYFIGKQDIDNIVFYSEVLETYNLISDETDAVGVFF